jgi:hypothetical protein
MSRKLRYGESDGEYVVDRKLEVKLYDSGSTNFRAVSQ